MQDKKKSFKRKVSILISIICLVFLINNSVLLAATPDVRDLGYYSGDAHVHTKYGGIDAPWVDVADQAADAQRAGLDWVQFTDHSDLVIPPFIKDYLTDEEWFQLVAETSLDYSGIKTLPGEEVTVGNGNDLKTLGHFLAYGITNRIEPYRVHEEKRKTSEEIINAVAGDGGFGYVAHPYPDRWGPDAPSWRDWIAFERGVSKGSVSGLEIINKGHIRTKTINRWDKYLQQGKKLFGIGNPDSHGTGIGSSFTYLYTGGTLTKSGIKEALRKGHATFSTGPFVTFSIGSAIPGDTVKTSVDSTLTLDIQWESNSEYGALEKIELFDQRTRTNGPPNPFKTLSVSGYSGFTTYNYQVQGEGYIRLRGETTLGKVSYTNPIFIKAKGASQDHREDEDRSITDPFDQQRPDISGNIVVWQNVVWEDVWQGESDIYLKNLLTGQKRRITTNPSWQELPKTDGNIITWVDYRNGYRDQWFQWRNADIYIYNLSTQTESPLIVAPGEQRMPAIYDNKIVWQDNRNGNWDIYMYDLTTNQESQITNHSADQETPAIYGDKIVWVDERNRTWWGGQAWDIYIYDIVTKEEKRLTPFAYGLVQWSPDIYGDKVVWADWMGTTEIFVYDLKSQQKQQITFNDKYDGNPAIFGNYIVYERKSHIYLYDLSKKREIRITSGSARANTPRIYGNKVVWEDYRNENTDVYIATLFRQSSVVDTSIPMAPGQISYQPVTIDPEMLQATFGTKFGSDVNLTLIQPDGVEITPTTPNTDYDISHTKESDQEYYRIDNPMPGVWQMKIEAVDVLPEGEEVGVNAQAVAETPPTVTINNPQDGAIVKGQVEISVQAQDDEEVTDFDLSINGEQVAVSTDKQTLSYTWDTTTFEDGYYQLSAIAQDPKLSFGQADSIVIVDNVMPVAEAGADQEADPGQELTFDGSNSTDVTEFGFTWDFGDGTKEEFTGPQVTHTYANPGLYTVTLTVQDAAGNTSTDTLKVKVGDAIPPAAVNDLKASREPTANSIKLIWTAPGDDDNLGQASTYDLRYSTEPITELNWDLATQVEGEPTPNPAGTQESFIVIGLSPGQTYYFSLKTADEVPNWSFLSNLATASTWSYIFEDSKNKNQLKIQTQVGEFEFYASSTQKNYSGTTPFMLTRRVILVCYRSPQFNLIAIAFPQKDLAFSYLYDKNLKKGYHLFDPLGLE